MECHPVGILVQIRDSRPLKPLLDCIDGLTPREEHTFHLIVTLEVFAIIAVAGRRHAH